jgi:formylglycine-generating enzyme required for sulfatase activity/serine/threonine protein kinase
MGIDSVGNLVDALCEYRLLDNMQRGELFHLQAQYTDPRILAKVLLQRGWLTPYQVNQLFRGQGDRLVLGQYVLLERIGEGGMGEVFKARHLGLDRIDALKVIRKDKLSNAENIRRFQREARAAARLSHPNIVAVYAIDQVGDTHYLAMEYVEGMNLSRFVKTHGPLPVPQACDFISQAAQGLQQAFQRGLIHRDIKPGNLLVSSTHVIKILDLGLVRLEQLLDDHASPATLTEEGSLMGTPDYIAPEQARDPHAVDTRADIYSLGCTFYHLLTGQPPFPGGTLAQKLIRHQSSSPLGVETLRPDVPPALAAVVRKMLEKDPAQRYQTPLEVAEALGPFRHATVPAGTPRAAAVIPSALPQGPLPLAGFGDGMNSAATNPDPQTPESRFPSATVRDVPPSRPPAPLSPPATPLEIASAQTLPPGEGVPPASRSGRTLPLPHSEALWQGTPQPFQMPPDGMGAKRPFPVPLPVLVGSLVTVVAAIVLLIVFWPSGQTPASNGTDPNKDKVAVDPNKDKVVVDPNKDKGGGKKEPELAKEIKNSIKMKLVLIPAGKFIMGSPEEEVEDPKAEEPRHNPNESPQHPVTITKPFYLSACEVTVGQFKAFVEAEKYLTEAERDPTLVWRWVEYDENEKDENGKRKFVGKFRKDETCNWLNPRFDKIKQTDDHPVVCVSWNDAWEFCQWLSRKEGKTYRLPTEAEWEYACRAGTTTPFAFGKSLSSYQANFDGSGHLGPYGDAEEGPYLMGTKRVGSYKANAFGLYDMHGNACEWCHDWYQMNYYAVSPPKDPQGHEKGKYRVVRGGYWPHFGGHCRSAWRWWYAPQESNNALSFRVVCVADTKKTP